jgi:predicted nucleotide-binding protein
MADEKPSQLKTPRTQAEYVIDRHQEEGRQLIDRAYEVGDEAGYREWSEALSRWRDLTVEGLRSIYVNGDPADQFRGRVRAPSVIGGAVDQEFEWEQEALGRGVNTLKSLRERLEYVEAPGETPAAPDEAAEVVPGGERIFLVHGHDGEVKETVARLLETTGKHEITILHEQPNGGKTIIEKFEEYAGASDLAVVLLTADDVGGKAPGDGDSPKLSPRGRQNVVFELGFFVGRLGRARSVVLFEDGVEPPSDYAGVTYISLSDDSWRYKLLQELRSAGLEFDLNKLSI